MTKLTLGSISIASILIAGSIQANAFCPSNTPCMGINRFELGSQFVQSNWGHVGEPEFDAIALNMSLKSMSDATSDGIRFIRFAAGDFGPNTYEGPGILRLWKADPEAFFSKYDRLFDEADRRGVKLVPALIWNLPQIPALAGRDASGRGETVPMMMQDPNSRSSQLAVQWVKSFVARYKDRASVLFWELGNEWNLGADWKSLEACYKDWGQGHEICQPKGNYTTNQFVQFANRLREAIRSVDSSRKISTGYGYPTPYAQNLRQKPQWTWGPKDGLAEDRQSQSEQYLSDIHTGFEIVSIHHYPDSRLQNLQHRSLLQFIQNWSQRRGQEVFVGEFGAPNGLSGGTNFTSSGYLLSTLRDILALNIRWSAAWVYQFYQNSPTVPNEFNIEQGMTDAFLQDLRQHTFTMEPTLRPTGAEAPNLLITAPATVDTTDARFAIHALASDDSGQVPSIRFLKGDGELIQQVLRPPFTTTVNPGDFPHGLNKITVEACDGDQNCTRQVVSFVRPGAPGPIVPPPPPLATVSCEISVTPQKLRYDEGETVELLVTSNPDGLSYRLAGSPEGLPEVADQNVTPARVQLTLPVVTQDQPRTVVSRRAVIRDQDGQVVCRTPSVRIRLNRASDLTQREAVLQMQRSHRGTR